MDRKYPDNIDPRPKRRRDKYNPYEIFSIGIHTDNPKYYLRFLDSRSMEHCIEIDRELFQALEQFELDDLSYLNEVDNHYERFVLSETALYARAAAEQESVEEIVIKYIQREALYEAIAQLPEIQRRRLLLYYFGGLTYQQIADVEKCSKVAVKYSVDNAIAALKRIL